MEITMKEYAVIYERGKEGEENWSAYAPDLPGTGTTGETFEEVEKNIREVIALHIRGMIEDGEPVPEPMYRTGSVQIAA